MYPIHSNNKNFVNVIFVVANKFKVPTIAWFFFEEMASASNDSYREMSLSSETPDSEFYSFLSFSELALKVEECMDEIVKCRTIGILNSEHGRYYLNDLTPSHEEFERIQVSMLYLEVPPQSTVMPYAVQLFGDLQWKKRPVLYARIMQVMTPAIAIKLNNVLADVKSLYLSKGTPKLSIGSET